MPVAPGIRPSVTSGMPNRIFASSSAKRAWPISATSQPPPSAVPLSSATTGLPSVSSARKLAFSASISAKPGAASFASSVSTPFSAAPAKKVDFAEASSTPWMRVLVAHGLRGGGGEVALPLRATSC